jgi:hypothetical protein
MTLSWIALNRWLLRAMLASIAIMLVLVVWPWVPKANFASAPDLQISDTMPVIARNASNFEEISRNVFDPSGQNWVTPAGRRAKSAKGAGGTTQAGNITGIIDLPGFRGVLADNKFVPIGGQAAGGTVESIENGKITINSSQGQTEIDINQNRKQQMQLLNIQIR